jgi:nucleoside-diphosphate-sugar epimerase
MESMKTILITGAAGFIGNAACRRWRDNYNVIGVDDLSRPTAKIPKGVAFIQDDAERATRDLWGIDIVVHLAAQVSVMESVFSPMNDFRRNAELTAALALRARQFGAGKFIFASTNKVFGERQGRFYPTLDTASIEPQTPYGISKATAALYVRELLPDTGVVFHQSCIYGDEQQGTFDQGWVGFVRHQIERGEVVTCYGNGTQKRDLLNVEDLLDAYDMAIEDRLPAGDYVIGGGPGNVMAFEEVVALLGGKIGAYADWRPHDQRYFCSANQRLAEYGWRPQVDIRQWLQERKTR